MGKILKITAVIFVVIGIAVIAVMAAARIIITPDRVRQVVIPRAEAALNRPVSIGDIRVNIFTGIGIRDFLIKTENGDATFVAADELVLRYKFWPLLRRRVILNEARLENPEIRLVRFENGNFNFSDLLKPKNHAPPEPENGTPLDLMVSEMRISGGMLNYLDRAAGQKPYEYRLINLSLAADDISLNHAFPFAFEAQLNGAPLSIEGVFNPQTLNGNLHITGNNIDVDKFSPYIAGRIPGKLDSMNLDFDISIEKKGNEMTSSGTIRAGQVNLTLDALPDMPLQNAELEISYDAAIDTEAETIRINQADADFNGILVEGSGAIASYGSVPVLDLQLSLPPTGTEAFLAALPRSMTVEIGQMKPEGRISADLRLSGPSDQMQALVQQGEVRLDAVRATYKDLRAGVDGLVKIKGDSVSGNDIAVNIADQTAMLDFTASDLTGTPILINHRLTSEALNLDKIMAALGGKEKTPSEKKTPEETEPSPPSDGMDLPLTVDGAVRVGKALYQGLEINDFNLKYRLEDNILDVTALSGQAAGGKISGKGRINLGKEKIGYDMDLSVDGTQADDLISPLFPAAANTIFGQMFLDADFSGSGLDLPGIRQSLSARADLRLTDGRLTGTGLTRGLSAFLNAERLEVLNFDAVEGNVRLTKGRFVLNTSYSSDDLRMSPTGTVGLDGSLDLSLNMRIAPELAGKISGDQLISRLLSDPQGWTLLPLNVGGSLTSPRFAIDSSAVQQQVREKATQELQRKIQERLFDTPDKQAEEDTPSDRQTPPAEQKEKQPSVDRMIEDTLKKIF
jgi:AsmA protein